MTDKAKKIIIVFLIVFAIIMGIILYFVSTSEERKLKNQQQDIIDKSNRDSNKVSRDKMRDFKMIDVDKYLELYKGKSASIVYIGRSDCQFCQTAEPIIQNIMYEKKFDIYYLSTDGFDSEDKTNMLNSDDYFKEKKGISTPSVLIVKDSSIVDIIEGLADKDTYLKFFKENNVF